MGKLFQLLLRNGGFVTFAVVELLCFVIIVQFNTAQSAIWANTTGIFGGRLLEKRQTLTDYIGLNARADSLVKEVARLQTELANARQIQVPYRDTSFTVKFDSIMRADSTRRKIVRPHYEFVTAKVIGNSINSANNWLIINRGSNDLVGPDMAVVSAKGIVGIVRHVDANFSIAMSVLHRQAKISAALQKQDAFGSLIWEGGDPSVMTLKFIPKHFDDIQVGDPVVTSGYSQMFPARILLGWVAAKPVQDPENPYFTQMKVRLSQDMASLHDVQVVRNLFGSELDSLKLKIRDEK
jgi:rod shape-determining protein MreC